MNRKEAAKRVTELRKGVEELEANAWQWHAVVQEWIDRLISLKKAGSLPDARKARLEAKKQKIMALEIAFNKWELVRQLREKLKQAELEAAQLKAGDKLR